MNVSNMLCGYRGIPVLNKGGTDPLVTLYSIVAHELLHGVESVLCVCAALVRDILVLIGPLGYPEQCSHHNYFGKAFYFCSCAHDLQEALAKACREMCVRAQLVLFFGM